jgi:hypothetical protein
LPVLAATASSNAPPLLFAFPCGVRPEERAESEMDFALVAEVA